MLEQEEGDACSEYRIPITASQLGYEAGPHQPVYISAKPWSGFLDHAWPGPDQLLKIAYPAVFPFAF